MYRNHESLKTDGSVLWMMMSISLVIEDGLLRDGNEKSSWKPQLLFTIV